MRGVAVVVVVMALAGTAPAANRPDVQERIVPGQAIGKVRLGMTLAQVKGVLGRPESMIQRRRLGFGKTFVEYSWNLTEWRIAFVGGRVVSVGSSVRAERTKERIGPGTLAKRVERVYATRCIGSAWKGDGSRHDHWCVLRHRGGTRTAFVIWGVCTKPRHNGNCPGWDYRYEVREVWIFAAGQELPVTLHPDQPLP